MGSLRARAPLVAALLLLLATPAGAAMEMSRTAGSGVQGPCIGDGIPPRIALDGCGPRTGVEIVLEFTSPDGAREVVIGSCGNACDLRVIVEVAVCESTRAVSTH